MPAKMMRDAAGYLFRKLVLQVGTKPAEATDPTITAGSGAPSAAEPAGSIYIRTGGASASQVIYVRHGGSWTAIPAA